MTILLGLAIHPWLYLNVWRNFSLAKFSGAGQIFSGVLPGEIRRKWEKISLGVYVRIPLPPADASELMQKCPAGESSFENV